MIYKELFSNYGIENQDKQAILAKKADEAFELICIHDINYLKVVGSRMSGKTLLLRMILEKLMVDVASVYKITQKEKSLDIIVINDSREQRPFIVSSYNSTTVGNMMISNNVYGPNGVFSTKAKSISVSNMSNYNPLMGYSADLILLDESVTMKHHAQSLIEMSIMGKNAKCIYIENQCNNWCLPCDFEVEL